MRSYEEAIKTGLEVAVIGMAGKFPKARKIDEFWDNLKNGVECISFFTDQELEETGIDPHLLRDPNYVRANAILEDIEFFDSSFFSYTPIEAEVMDPQIRIFHECSWEALEDAGYVPENYKGRIGVYAGAASHLNWENLSLISGKSDVLGQFASWQLYDKDFISTRLSYNLNLLGPSITVNTACSTSLVAVHLACQGLLSGECHMALAGGVKVMIPGKKGYLYQEGMIVSSDGHCRTFDDKADGTVFSEGVGIVVLKLFERAIADGDFIYAIIKSSAINNDGKSKVGYTAPSVKGQAGVIRTAFHLARVRPESIGYLEAHGTGTNLGDPTEVEALIQAFNTDKKGFCRIGSVKSNIGHLDTAAGIAGFIKVVLALKHKQIPPSLHFETPSPKIDFENSPFIVSTELYQWKNNGHPLRAGVSSFGAGGTNAHAILEEAPVIGHSSLVIGETRSEREYRLILLSAKIQSALEQMTGNFVEYLKKNPHIELTDAAYSLAVGRKTFKHRKMLVTSSIHETIDYLSNPGGGKVHEFTAKDDDRPVVFMFPGQGSQYVNMGLELYKNVPLFRQETDRCFEILKPLMGYDIKEILYPDFMSNRSDRSYMTNINHTQIAQPILFTIEYALARLLMQWGIKPYAMIGHSIGEYVAACLSGVFSLEEVLEIAAIRGRLMQKMPPGAMLSVSLAPNDLIPLLPDELSLAAVNTPSFCVVSGTHEAITDFSKKMERKKYKCRLLQTSHAFHSKMMDPILKEFEEKVRRTSLNKPCLPYISNLTGKWIAVEDAENPTYWAKHLRQTVQFSDGLEELLKVENAVLIEVGPGKSLSTFARQNPEKKSGHDVIDLVRHPKETVPDDRFLLDQLGQLWLYGVEIDWSGFYSKAKRRRVPLPTYPFERLHYPISGDPLKMGLELLAKKSRGLGKKKEMTDWFYVPLWEKSIPLLPQPLNADKPFNWLIFIDEHGLGSRLIKKLEQAGQHVVVVNPGSEFGKENDLEFIIDPGQDNDYLHLFDGLQELKVIPNKILHLWCITGNSNNDGMQGFERGNVNRAQDLGFYSLINIARSVERIGIKGDIQLGVVTNNMQEVIGEERLCLEKATILGAVKTIPLEYSNLRCCSMDIDGTGIEEKLPDHLLVEFSSGFSDQVIAFRRNHRWVQVIKPVPFAEPGELTPLLRKGGVYLITGGLGGIGLTLAQYLAKSVGARLVLTGRSTFPDREEWDQWLSTHTERDQTCFKIRKLLEIEKWGGKVLVLGADVANAEQMQEVTRLTRERFGGINGVIHSAGLPDDGIIQRRTREMTEKVFAPKIKGTLVLDHILKKEPLDFFVLCSSLSSILATIGQVAYSAANAFQDTFASYKTSADDGIFTVSINWDAWQVIGMAVEAVKKRTGDKDIQEKPVVKIPHPLFDYCMEKNSNEKIYITNYSVNKHWVLDEHRLLGRPTLPGTALVEMARAAFEHHTGNETMEIREFFFLTPFRINEGDEKEIHTVLRKEGDHYKLMISSRLDSFADQWQEHARGEMAELVETRTSETGPVKNHDIKEIMERCNEVEIIVTREMLEGNAPQGPLNIVLGQRWKSLRKVNHRDNQVLLLLELPEEFIGDIGVYKLHPALLDTAVGYYGGKYPVVEANLPFSYKGMKITAPLSRRIYSYMRYEEKNQEEGQFLKYTITIMDEQGRELVGIEEYRRLILTEDAMARLSNEISTAPEQETVSTPVKKEEEFLKHGLLPAEGIEVFRRILGRRLPRAAVSTIDFAARAESVKAVNASSILKEMTPEKPRGPLRPRPETNKAFVAPASDMEQKISQIWQQFLGLEQIGINDNFFELGGDSLMLAGVNSQLEKTLGKDIPVVTLYDKPTIKSLSEYLSREEMKPGISKEEAERLKEKRGKGKTTLKQRKQRRQGL